jgi:hypothetical protein
MCIIGSRKQNNVLFLFVQLSLPSFPFKTLAKQALASLITRTHTHTRARTHTHTHTHTHIHTHTHQIRSALHSPVAGGSSRSTLAWQTRSSATVSSMKSQSITACRAARLSQCRLHSDTVSGLFAVALALAASAGCVGGGVGRNNCDCVGDCSLCPLLWRGGAAGVAVYDVDDENQNGLLAGVVVKES